MTPAERRLSDARERLRAALIEGEDTTVLRESIARMLADADKAEQRRLADEIEIEGIRNTNIATRASEIVADVQSRLDAALAPFAIPEETVE